MDENAMFPEELHVYHNLHYVICSFFPVFSAIPDGYDIDTVISHPDDEFLDRMEYDGVEMAGLYGHRAKDVKKMLEDAGLCAISAHIAMADTQPLRESPLASQ